MARPIPISENIKDPEYLTDPEAFANRGKKRKDVRNHPDYEVDDYDPPLPKGSYIDSRGRDLSQHTMPSDSELGIERSEVRKSGTTEDGLKYDTVYTVHAGTEKAMSDAIDRWRKHNWHLVKQSEVVSRYYESRPKPWVAKIYFRALLDEDTISESAVNRAFAATYQGVYNALKEYDYPLLESTIKWAVGAAENVDEAVLLAAQRLVTLDSKRARVSGVLESWGCKTPEQLERLAALVERQVMHSRKMHNEALIPQNQLPDGRRATVFMVVGPGGDKIAYSRDRATAMDMAQHLCDKHAAPGKYTVQQVNDYPVMQESSRKRSK